MALTTPRARRLATGVLSLAVAALFAGGCQNKSSQSKNKIPEDSQLAARSPASAAPKDPQPAPPATAAVTSPVDPRIDPAQALAARINSYAQEIGPLTDHRPKGNVAPTTQPVAPAKPAPAPPAPVPPPNVVPLANPVVDNQPSVANSAVKVSDASAQTASIAQPPMRVTPEEMNHPAAPPAKPAALGADLEAKLTKRLNESPTELWAHLDYQLLQFLRDEQVPQLDALTSLSLADRELVSVVMDGLTNFRNGLRADNNMLMSKKIRPLLELADRLRSQADLNIPAMALCKSVERFGVYEPIDPPRFIAGKEHEAILYCEVENFACTSIAEKKLWQTRLTQEATLYTESGMPVWVDKSGKVVDMSRTRRHDFFVVKRIDFPATLTIGRYLLKVTVEDQEAKRVAEQTIPVEIVARLNPELAGGEK
jgi:hypothetical protein